MIEYDMDMDETMGTNETKEEKEGGNTEDVKVTMEDTKNSVYDIIEEENIENVKENMVNNKDVNSNVN